MELIDRVVLDESKIKTSDQVIHAFFSKAPEVVFVLSPSFFRSVEMMVDGLGNPLVRDGKICNRPFEVIR